MLYVVGRAGLLPFSGPLLFPGPPSLLPLHPWHTEEEEGRGDSWHGGFFPPSPSFPLFRARSAKGKRGDLWCGEREKVPSFRILPPSLFSSAAAGPSSSSSPSLLVVVAVVIVSSPSLLSPALSTTPPHFFSLARGTLPRPRASSFALRRRYSRGVFPEKTRTSARQERGEVFSRRQEKENKENKELGEKFAFPLSTGL